MREPEKKAGSADELDMKDRPSRARYDKVKHALDLKWRRREPQPDWAVAVGLSLGAGEAA